MILNLTTQSQHPNTFSGNSQLFNNFENWLQIPISLYNFIHTFSYHLLYASLSGRF